MAGFEVSLEEVVKGVASENGFSHNGVSFSLDDYFDGEVLSPDWLYFLARDMENNRNQLELSLEERFPVGTQRLYESLPESVKEKTTRPTLSHEVYFEMMTLIENNPKRYQGRGGYIQLARDLRENVEGFKANLGNIWSATSEEIREKLKWERKIDLPLDAFNMLEKLIEDSFNPESERFERYQGDAGYVKLAEDLRKKVKGFKANLSHIWTGTDEKTRTKLKWERKIDLPLDAFDMLKGLIEDSFNPESERYQKYQGDAGYVKIAKDLRCLSKGKFEPYLGNIWSGTDKELREKLDWTYMIQRPLKVFDRLEELIRDDPERYRSDAGDLLLAEDLRKGGVDVPLRIVRAGAIDYVDDLGWADVSLYGLKDRESRGFVRTREDARDGMVLSGKNGRTSLVEDVTNEKYQNGQQNVNLNYAENVTDLKEAL